MLWFEALPSPRGADRGRLARDLERLAPLAQAGVQRILVPEVLDGQHATVDNVRFAGAATRWTGIPTGAAVCLPPRDHAALAQRAGAAEAAGVDTLLLVGATHRDEVWHGPGVEEALRLLRSSQAGVVTIPARRRWRIDEPHRLLRKQRAGAAFTVSQILFEAEEALDMRRAYIDALAPGEAPIPVVYSLAPVRRVHDLAFLHGLGVHVPHGLANTLREAGAERRGAIARDAALRVAGRLAQVHEDEGLGPLGFCVSHVMVGNVAAGIGLATALHDELRPVITA